jgi:putative intracellular protease/amidase/YHS domain-containing protein
MLPRGAMTTSFKFNRERNMLMKNGNISRRQLLQGSAVLGCLVAAPLSIAASEFGSADQPRPSAVTNPLKPPAEGAIPVAFLVSDGAVVIDFAGPWEVFQDVMIPGRMDMPFQLYTVSESTKPIQASGGMKIVPDYTLENAPAPKVLVIPAQSAPSEAVLAWVRKSAKTADVTMSVCTGAYLLAKTGLLAGKSATTHHASYVDFSRKYPDIQMKRGARFVEDGNLATAGGLSSGIDLALRVVERYYGREVATQAAFDMEYQGQGWKNADANAVYAKLPSSLDGHPLCVVCSMAIDPATALKTVYKGKTYYFCSSDHKATFDAGPADFVKASK